MASKYVNVEKGVVVMSRSRWVTGLSGVLTAGLLAAGVSVLPGGAAFAAADPQMSIAPMPVTPVSLAQAGEVVQWRSGAGAAEALGDVPASLSGVAVSQVAMADTVGFAVTAAGRLVAWGANQARLEKVPSEVASADVVQVATSNNYAGVVTRSGEVRVWSNIKRTFTTPRDVPTGLTGVKQLALANYYALALRQDGSVVAWGTAETEPGEPPAGLPPLAAISLTNDVAYGLTTAGTVVGWDSHGRLTLPAAVRAKLEQPGNVKSVSALASTAGVAVLQSGEVVSWGTTAPPAAATAKPAVALVGGTGGSSYKALVDVDGVIHHWDPSLSTESGLVPAGLNGRALAYLALGFYGDGAAIVTKLLRAADPQLGGSAVVGQTLTATPGTFSASPDAVTSQWLANGAPIAGASGTTLPVTAGLLGKSISYQSTATKAGEAPVTSTSAAVTVTNPATPPTPPAPLVDSTTKVVSVKVAKKAKLLEVVGKVAAAKPVTGTATVTITKGKKAILAKSVAVSATGAVKLTVKKFGKLVIKKTKPKKGKKGKKKPKKATYRGKYVVSIAYAGNAQVKPSSGSKAFVIKK